MPDDKHYVEHKEWDDARTDDRADQGVIHQTMREDWRAELRLELRSFKNEMRIMLLATLAILKLNLPSTLSIGAVSLFALKAAVGFFRN